MIYIPEKIGQISRKSIYQSYGINVKFLEKNFFSRCCMISLLKDKLYINLSKRKIHILEHIERSKYEKILLNNDFQISHGHSL